MSGRRVGLLGATSLVGQCLLPLLAGGDQEVLAFSRHGVARAEPGVVWQTLGGHALAASLPPGQARVAGWICSAPIWVLPHYFDVMKSCGAKRVVALSSTSLFTKGDSSDRGERAVAGRLAEGEARLRTWAEENGIEWLILRPTLIYGFGRDRNLSEIARFIQRFGFFPLSGQAQGLRQPVHAGDVAAACVAALERPTLASRAYNLSGGETLTYREMVCRVFTALGRPPRPVTVPLGVVRMAVALLRIAPRYRHLTAAMAERMNRDLVFDHGEAAKDFGFAPRPFSLSSVDLSPPLE